VVTLSTSLRNRMKEKRLTAKALAHVTGVKESTIHNLTTGRSKNPTLKNLRALSKAFHCTVSELVGEDEFYGETSAQEAAPSVWNHELYVDTLLTVSKLLGTKKAQLKRMHIHKVIEDVYRYSLKKNKESVDIDFAEWKLEDALSQKNLF
jgi:transcriptional regulator with XRE-family HTH domain